MSRDFTFKIYRTFLEALNEAGYAGVPFRDFVERPDAAGRTIILRHDVDRRPRNALRVAEMQQALGFRGSYYFRALPCSHDEEVIRRIAGLGHEIGYHYEELALAGGNVEVAMELFKKHLARLRELYPVTTMCMHGSPASRHDNRDLWELHDYRDHGIIAEPYFDVDFSQVFYVTDTGRGWNRQGVSVRDRVGSAFDHLRIDSTHDLVRKIRDGELPGRIMMNIHPQRWNDDFLPWTSELVGQSVKNVVKKWVFVGR